MSQPLRVVILKPSKYTADGYVERFRWGFMPNSTVPYMRSMTPAVGERHADRSPFHRRIRPHGPAIPLPAQTAAGRPDAAGAGGRAEPPVPSRAGPGGVRPAATGAWRSSAGRM